MKIYLDNIIFSIQRAGGISVVWSELIKRALKDRESGIKFFFLDQPQSKNIFRNQLDIPNECLLKTTHNKYFHGFQRYLNPHIPIRGGVFHSSYYRVVSDYYLHNVTTVHDFTYEYYRKGIARKVHSIQKSNAIRKSKRIICVSENTKKDLFKFFPDINEKDVRVVYNGVDNVYAPILEKNENQIKQIVPFSSFEYVLFVGGRDYYKNFEIAVKACKKADVPLVIVGGGQITRLENDLLEKNLRNSHFVHLSGINNIQLNILYNYALCLIYPSIYEGFGIPVVEAQRAGCPVISTKYSSIPEIAGKGAVLLNKVTDSELAESINQIKCDSEMTDSLKAKGFHNSQRFSWDKTYQQTKEIYKEIYEKYL